MNRAQIEAGAGSWPREPEVVCPFWDLEAAAAVVVVAAAAATSKQAGRLHGEAPNKAAGSCYEVSITGRLQD